MPDEFKALPLTGPRLVAADLPFDPKERETLLFAAVGAGVDLANFPQYYHPYYERTAAAIAKAKPLAELREKRPGFEADLSRVVEAFGHGSDHLAFLPVRARKQDLSAIIDRRNGNVIARWPRSPTGDSSSQGGLVVARMQRSDIRETQATPKPLPASGFGSCGARTRTLPHGPRIVETLTNKAYSRHRTH